MPDRLRRLGRDQSTRHRWPGARPSTPAWSRRWAARIGAVDARGRRPPRPRPGARRHPRLALGPHRGDASARTRTSSARSAPATCGACRPAGSSPRSSTSPGYSGSRAGRNLAPVDDRAARAPRRLLPPFEMAVREGGARSVMHSYAEIDGVPVGGRPELLTDAAAGRVGLRRHGRGATTSASPSCSTLHDVAADRRRRGRAGADGRRRRRAADGARLRATPLRRGRRGRGRRRARRPRRRRVLRQKFELGLLDPLAARRGRPRTGRARPAAARERGPPAGRGVDRPAGQRRRSCRCRRGSPWSGRRPTRPTRSSAATPSPATSAAPPGHAAGIEVPTVLARRMGPALTAAPSSRARRAATSTGRRVADRGGRRRGAARPTSRRRASATAPGCSAAAPPARAATPTTWAARACRPSSSTPLLDTGTPDVLVLLTGRPYALARSRRRWPRSCRRSSRARRAGRRSPGCSPGRVNPSRPAAGQRAAQAGGAALHLPASRLGERDRDLERRPRSGCYPFGHGLSYTRFEHSA